MKPRLILALACIWLLLPLTTVPAQTLKGKLGGTGVVRRAAVSGGLPTTGLTYHADASDNGNIWTTWSGTTPFHSGVPVDGNAIQTSEDDNAKDIAGIYQSDPSQSPIWRSTTPVMALPNLDFDGTNDALLLCTKPGIALTFADLFTASAFTIVIAFRVDAIDTTTTTLTDQDALVSDNNGQFGALLQDNAGTPTVHVYNHGASNDTVDLAISLSTDYILMMRHDAGTLYGTVYNTSGSVVASGSVVSGNTAVTAGGVLIGRGNAAFFDGRIGEVAFYNIGDSTNATNAVSYFVTKW